MAWLKLSDIQTRLSEAGQRWVAGMSSAERHGTEIVLNNVGVESFLKHWTFDCHTAKQCRGGFLLVV